MSVFSGKEHFSHICAYPTGLNVTYTTTSIAGMMKLSPEDVSFDDGAFELLLVPSDSFGCEGFIRIAYCVTTEMIERSLPAFKKLAEAYGK